MHVKYKQNRNDDHKVFALVLSEQEDRLDTPVSCPVLVRIWRQSLPYLMEKTELEAYTEQPDYLAGELRRKCEEIAFKCTSCQVLLPSTDVVEQTI